MSYVISVDVLSFIYILIMVFLFCICVYFGLAIGTKGGNAYILAQNKRLKKQNTELKEEVNSLKDLNDALVLKTEGIGGYLKFLKEKGVCDDSMIEELKNELIRNSNDPYN